MLSDYICYSVSVHDSSAGPAPSLNKHQSDSSGVSFKRPQTIWEFEPFHFTMTFIDTAGK